MPQKTIDDIRALIDPEGYLRGMREVLDNYKAHLARLLVDYDLMAADETLTEQQRHEVLNRTQTTMLTILRRVELIEEQIKGVKDGGFINRAERKRATKEG